jgi:hypothetical protein
MTISFFFRGRSRIQVPWKWNRQMSAQPVVVLLFYHPIWTALFPIVFESRSAPSVIFHITFLLWLRLISHTSRYIRWRLGAEDLHSAGSSWDWCDSWRLAWPEGSVHREQRRDGSNSAIHLNCLRDRFVSVFRYEWSPLAWSIRRTFRRFSPRLRHEWRNPERVDLNSHAECLLDIPSLFKRSAWFQRFGDPKTQTAPSARAGVSDQHLESSHFSQSGPNSTKIRRLSLMNARSMFHGCWAGPDWAISIGNHCSNAWTGPPESEIWLNGETTRTTKHAERGILSSSRTAV